MKRKLTIEELSVESFATTAEGRGGRGTVRAHESFLPTPETGTEPETLQQSCAEDGCAHTVFVYSCGSPDTECRTDVLVVVDP